MHLRYGCLDAMAILSPQSITDVQWQHNNINCSKNNFTKSEPVIEISSDASSFGWRAVCNNIRTGGAFSLDEMQYHTNAKELLAANYSLKTFVKYLIPFLSCFQTTLLLYMALTICTLINLICVISLYLKFGLALWTKSFALLLPTFKKRRTMMQMRNHAKSKLNWNGCLTKNFSQELFLSLNFNQRQTYLLQDSVPNYQCLSRINLTQRLCMLMLFPCQGRPFYPFPPFPIIGKVLHQIVLDVAIRIIVAPNWSKKPQYSLLMQLLIDIPILLHSSKTLLQHPAKSKPHRLPNKLNLLACMISGKIQEQQTFQHRALGSSSRVYIP